MAGSVSGRAQELTATLAGSITDTTGAVIPGATLTLTLNGVNAVARTVVSTTDGSYVVTNLQAGTYSVKATAVGFETNVAKNVVLNVAEKHTLNLQLKAGAVTTTVTVEDNPISVDTQSSAQAGTITGVQVRELELSSRNFEQLVTLQPGVISGLGDESSMGSTSLAINGARTTANNWTVDGADINDSGSNSSIVNAPSVDAIQEFTLQRGTYDAGYGRSGGGQILVQTKSGTSSFHGSAYEFVRNTSLDANDSYTKYTQVAAGEPNERAVNHRNDFGFTIGGPIFIPKFYNTGKTKTFFFWSEEWHKVSTPGNDSFAAASQSQLQGVVNGEFTGGSADCLSYDATSNTTTIASSCYSANSKVYLTNVFDKFPANTTSGNYAFSYSNKNNLRNDIVRVDHYFNDKLHFYARGMQDDVPSGNPEGLWAGSNYPGLVASDENAPGKNVVGNLTWTISPTIVNEVEFVWAQGEIKVGINPGQFATDSTLLSSLTNNWAYTDPYGRMPSVSINGVTGFTAGSAPYTERNLDRTYFDNLAMTFKKHTVRVGFQLQQMLKTENGTSGNPSFSFNSWGDFLLGNVESYSQVSRDIIPNLHYVNAEAYAQDDWKISKNLTLNLGVRWSRFPSPTDVNNTLSNFDPAYFSAADAPVIGDDGNFVAGQYVNDVELLPATYTNGIIFPKGSSCAAAQAIAPLTSCSPYGAYVNPNYNANFAPRAGFAYNPDGRGITSIRGGYGIVFDRRLNGMWEQNAFANPPLAQTTTVNNGTFDSILGTEATASYGPNGLIATGTPTFKTPYYESYNLSVSRQLLPTTTLEVAYVGNVARHLSGDVDLNQPTVAAREAANGSLTPEEATVSVNAIRPYAGYAKIKSRNPVFTNNYNSLQVSLNHRSSKGLTVGIAYTWSKDLTTMSSDRDVIVTNSHDLKQDYGPSATNTPQVFMANYVYELPFFRHDNSLKGRVLGGWEVSGITQMVSGSSFQVTQNKDPWDPNGTNVGLGLGATRPLQVSSVHKTKSFTQWFSTDSFEYAVGQFGNEGSNSLMGPGYQNWDLAAVKNLTFAERYKFQLRGEFFNAFNHTNFSGVDSSLDDDPRYNGTDTGSFGYVTSTHVPRRIQIGAKLYF